VRTLLEPGAKVAVGSSARAFLFLCFSRPEPVR